MAGLFIRWLDEYVHLEDAGYITVGLVGLRLLIRAINPAMTPPEWLMIAAVAGVFAWGFSQRTPQKSSPESETKELLVTTPADNKDDV